jgi:peptidoglycan/xylan/chitin deacetylase (PgdA/CDA1 family)
VQLHGHEHRYPAGDPDAFAADLEPCRQVIVGLGLPEPRHYCYPSGAFDAQAEATLTKAGVRSATTCLPCLVRPGRDARRRHYLPRFLDGDNIDMLVFEAEMSGFADVLRRVAGR